MSLWSLILRKLRQKGHLCQGVQVPGKHMEILFKKSYFLVYLYNLSHTQTFLLVKSVSHILNLKSTQAKLYVPVIPAVKAQAED